MPHPLLISLSLSLCVSLSLPFDLPSVFHPPFNSVHTVCAINRSQVVRPAAAAAAAAVVVVAAAVVRYD
ncbi:hypothetical protein M752DRAFT_273508 [Aspergillus phoenicis ATCC 13157]|uniref:Secreted peptide n=1 Tax=Aspergillus phoenicis ATCC 13157 TaxID=1353007 RepID=A0A370PW40_ASPPH|nr:hypothetical protein M752DRAFT_273508 [Aspergillus phoenicis ATCC 13157]